MPRVLISVSDKTGLIDFVSCLKKIGGFSDLQIIATGNTAKSLKEAGHDCATVDSITQFPEILDGRVKTLHPKIFAGILARDSEKDRKGLKEHGIGEIDYVIVNLYPFEKKAKEGLNENEMVEQIDIGGVALIRAAAKNFSRVVIACAPAQYEEIIQELQANQGTTTLPFRRKLAQAAFARTSEYDRHIAGYFSSVLGAGEHSLSGNKCNSSAGETSRQGANASAKCGSSSFADSKSNALPDSLNLELAQYQHLRYGENPHQSAVWYSNSRPGEKKSSCDSFPPFEQLQGKEMSSNNIIDTYSLVRILRDIASPSCCIIKHNNPCGVAIGGNISEALEKAYATDPDSAFGGVYGFSEPVPAQLAEKITQNFVEIVAAPDFAPKALEIFQKKKNVRVLRFKPALLNPDSEPSYHARDLQDFGWIVERDVDKPVNITQFQSVSGDNLSIDEAADAQFAWAVVKHLTSNAIFIAKGGCSLGFGIGQTSRIASMRIALAQAGANARGAILASDAFFPAVDNIEAAAKAGIGVIIQPGGSLKDKEVIAACNQFGIKMLFTGQRVFKH